MPAGFGCTVRKYPDASRATFAYDAGGNRGVRSGFRVMMFEWVALRGGAVAPDQPSMTADGECHGAVHVFV